MNVVAIDQGTSSTKALVVGGDGRILASTEVPVRPSALPDGGVEQDPEELYQSVLGAGTRAHFEERGAAHEHIEIVLDDYHGISHAHEDVQRANQLRDIRLMKPGGRFVEDVQGVSFAPRAQL